ncbi:MAG: HNH endonuclease signature motif containing protein [Propionibacteriaceae bacterium]|nr:HNH endonuclease signature motif containing protein [Propionibacteriaceae bacterium]
MPYAPPGRCACGLPATKLGRCARHQRPPWETPSRRNQLLDKNRWAKIAAAHLKRWPDCAHCGATAVHTDHIINIANGGALYDDANLQSLCEPCHAIKTEKERAAAAQRRRKG